MNDQEKIVDLETRLVNAEREIAEMRERAAARIESGRVGSVGEMLTTSDAWRHTCAKSGRVFHTLEVCVACINEEATMATKFGPGPNGYW